MKLVVPSTKMLKRIEEEMESVVFSAKMLDNRRGMELVVFSTKMLKRIEEEIELVVLST
jgi:hypothetical protein